MFTNLDHAIYNFLLERLPAGQVGMRPYHSVTKTISGA